MRDFVLLKIKTFNTMLFNLLQAVADTAAIAQAEAVQQEMKLSHTPSHAALMGMPCREGDYIVFRIRANRFLRNMVRAIVGSLIEVGRGKKDPSWISGLIASGSRSDAGQSVPGNALFFCGAEY